jgi:FlaA1/EpsC-like NDP-sugar epimerase
MCLEMNELDLNSKIFFIGDVRNKEAMQNVFSKNRTSSCFMQPHTSMSSDGRKSISSYFDQYRRTKILADLSCQYKVKKFVMVSTDKAVNPSNVMVLVKELPKNTCNLYNLKIKTQAKKTTLNLLRPFWKRFRIQWFCCSLV